ncbi:MAG: outer membrane beta-barrel domain-containing protein [Myxococcaceae bacterium]|nr:outer membrane beta-barrel domain-containing protein [Myxococcaceae bacterium]
MNRIAVLWAFLLATAALAQNQFDGLDLSDDKKEDPKKDTPPSSRPATPPPAAKADAPVKQEEKGLLERDITQEDRVKSVQRKLYLKRGRFELSPSVTVSVNDPYYQKFGFGVRAAFYPADALAIAARFSLMQVLPTDDVRSAKKDFQSRIFFSVPYWMTMADLEWSPFYGKVAFLNSILHLDAYVLGGMGVVYTETSVLPERTVNIGADLGFGIRFVATDWFAVNAALINTTYVDQPAGTTKGAVQNVMMVHAGVSVFFPFKSTYREAE